MSYRSKVYLFVDAEKEEILDSFLEALHFEGSVEKKLRRDGSFYAMLGCNTDYQPYVSDMIRVCLGSLLHRANEIKEWKCSFPVSTMLTIVPHLVDNEEPQQCLSLDKDIIEWLYLSDSEMDLDYYLA
ncbi:MAG: hypothetical protein J6038_03545 [Bacilli bacterium]|nr:hypothetical protein [Bacilli bacterium]